jgi:calcineurin-like phosphoesterase family protein
MAAILVALLLAACGDGGPAKAAEPQVRSTSLGSAKPADPQAPSTSAGSAKPADPQARSTSAGSAKPAEPRLHFTAAGDFGSTEETDAVLKMIKSLHSDATFALGDLSYGRTGAENQWCDYVTSRLGEDYPFELVAGNHESDGRNGNIDAFSSCLPNKLPGLIGSYGTQYYVDVPAKDPLVRFVMISPGIHFPDGEWDYRQGSSRYDWTARAIDAAREKSIPWVVVGMHKPCLSVGRYGCQSGSDLLHLLVSKRVDLILGGHDHSYQRSKQLALSRACKAIATGSFDQECVADEDSSLVRGAGSVSVVAATGGRNQYRVSSSDSEAGYFTSFAGGNDNPTYGVLDVTVTKSAMRASFVRAAGGTHTDTFSISAAR